MSTCTRKVLTAIAEKGHSVDFELVDMMKGEHKQPAHMARHPFGVVPSLEDDGFSMYESRAIIRYVDAKLPGASLTPTNLHERGRMDQYMSIEQSYLSPGAMKIVMQLMFGKMRGQEPDLAIVEKGKSETAHVFDVAEKDLAGHEFLSGSTFSLADICWLPIVQYVVQSGEGALVTDRPNVAAWWKRVSTRPSWMKVVG